MPGRPRDTRRRFLASSTSALAALAALALGPTLSSRERTPHQAVRRRTTGVPGPVMVPVPAYMVYAQLTDGRLIGIQHVLSEGRVMARYSRDEATSFSEPEPLFRLDPEAGVWALHNAFTGQDGELHLAWQSSGGTDDKPFRERRYDIFHVRSANGRREWVGPTLAWRGYAGSMLSFIQLSSGRIVLPFCYLTPRTWANRGTGFDAYTYYGSFESGVLYSDDAGAHWTQSPSTLKVTTPALSYEGAIEPIALQVNDGRVWILIRSQWGRFFETFSDDGAVWSPPAPSPILSSDSPCSLTRLKDGRVVMLWNCTLRFPYANGGRAVLHAAVSEDDGRTWRGCREVARNPLVSEPPPPRGDHGVTYPVPTLTDEGHIVTSLSVGGAGGYYVLRFDPEWLYETTQQDDFSHGLRDWSTFGTRGVEMVADPAGVRGRVLAVRKPDAGWPAGAVWNFPSGARGRLRVRMRLAAASGGIVVGLTDHFSVPFDDLDQLNNVFNLHIGPGGRLDDGGRVPSDRWVDLELAWDTTRRECRVTLDGRPAPPIPAQRQSHGIFYLRLRSTALTTDPAGVAIASVRADVSGD